MTAKSSQNNSPGGMFSGRDAFAIKYKTQLGGNILQNFNWVFPNELPDWYKSMLLDEIYSYFNIVSQA